MTVSLLSHTLFFLLFLFTLVLTSQPRSVENPSRPLQENPFRFHVIGLAFTRTNQDYLPCAFTQKVWRFSKMMTEIGHQVFHYGAEGSNLTCTEHIDVLSKLDQERIYPYDFKKGAFFSYSGTDEAHQIFAKNAIIEINKRKQPSDFLIISNGQREIAWGVNLANTVELGIGYLGPFSDFRVWESYAWMHFMRGKENDLNGHWNDIVIPNFYYLEDFEFSEQKDDYFLFMGRLTDDKGCLIAAQVCQELGVQLLVAGQGSLEAIGVTAEEYPVVKYVGVVGLEQRKQLLAKAKGLFVPTIYYEPFGGVAVEAMLSGTPVMSTDWGVFPETIIHGVTGFRCRSFADFLWAAKNIHLIQPKVCREWAEVNYSVERVREMYVEYFRRIRELNRHGWNDKATSSYPDSINWLYKYPPRSLSTISSPTSKYRDSSPILRSHQTQNHSAAHIDFDSLF